MTVTYDLEPADVCAFLAYNRWHSKQHARMRYIGVAVFAFLSLQRALTHHRSLHERVISFCVTFVVFLVVVPTINYLFRALMRFRSLTPDKQPGLICKHTITLASDALVELTPVNEGRHQWSAILKVADTPRHIFFYIAENSAHTVPKRAFQNPEEITTFLTQARQLQARARRDS